MKTKTLILCGALLLAAAVRGQQPHPENDPVGENLFPPELIMQNQKAIGLDEAQKSYIRTEITKTQRSEEHTSELQSLAYLVCRLLLEKKKKLHKRTDEPKN